MLKSDLAKAISYLIIDSIDQKTLSDAWSKCSDVLLARKAIDEIEALIKATREDRFNIRQPFYFVYLSYAYHLESDWFNAIRYANRALDRFISNRHKQNQTVVLWMLSILYCYYENFESARSRQGQAITLIKALQSNINRSGDYYLKNRSYQYQDVIDDIVDTYDRSESYVLHKLKCKLNRPVLPLDFFRKLIALLLIPSDNEFKYLHVLRRNLVYLDKPEISQLESLLVQINKKTSQTHSLIEKAVVSTLGIHVNNLMLYFSNHRQAHDVETHIRSAILLVDVGDINYHIFRCYLDLMYYNRDIDGVGRTHLESANRHLGDLEIEYSNAKFTEYHEIGILQRDIHSWIFPYELSDMERTELKPISASVKRVLEFVENKAVAASKKQTGTPLVANTSSGPARTQMKNSKAHFVGNSASSPQQMNQSGSDALPVSSGGHNSKDENHTTVKRIVIPVDVQALGIDHLESAPATHELFEKLEHFNETESDHENDAE